MQIYMGILDKKIDAFQIIYIEIKETCIPTRLKFILIFFFTHCKPNRLSINYLAHLNPVLNNEVSTEFFPLKVVV
jgi:hypothetical protein